MGNIETTTKFPRLKSISSIEDTYLEAATGGSIKKAVLKNFAIFTRKQLCWSFSLTKLQAAYRKSETQDPKVGLVFSMKMTCSNITYFVSSAILN